MHFQLISGVFIFTLVGVECGIFKLFNDWTDELEHQNIPLDSDSEGCIDKREATEESNDGPTKQISLLDIEDAQTKLDVPGADQQSSKVKRCPMRLRSKYNGPLVGASYPLSLNKRQSSEVDNEKKCRDCMTQISCKILKKCEDCDKYCNPLKQELVGMSSRFADSKNDSIFSKTMYPVSTYKEGETKHIICRILGIDDASDIETLTIWVTTFSNNPPKLPGAIDQFVDTSKPDDVPDQRLRMGIDDKEDTEVPENNNMPPPAQLDSHNNPIIVQPAEFMDDSNNDDSSVTKQEPIEKPSKLPDFGNRFGSSLPVESKPPLLAKANLPKESPARGGFLQSLFKHRNSNSGKVAEPIISSVDASNVEKPAPATPAETLGSYNDPLTNTLPGSGNFDLVPKTGFENVPAHKFDQINQAVQEVKEMVKNIQMEAQKASDQRLLGEPVPNSAILGTESNPGLIPPRVSENIGQVNKYLTDRAQDALDTIGQNEKEHDVPVSKDDHSGLTKKLIKDFKKIPQFFLDKFKNTVEAFDKPKLDSGSLDNEVGQVEDPALIGRMGSGEVVVQATEPTTVNMEPDKKSSNFKNKLDKYMTELKDKRQKMFPLDKKAEKDIRGKENEQTDFPLVEDINEQPNKKDLLKDKLQKYIEQVKMKSNPASEVESKIDPSAAEQNPDLSSRFTENDELGQPSPVRSSDVTNQFLPTVPSFIPLTEKPNKLLKYVEDLRSRISPPKTNVDLLQKEIKKEKENLARATENLIKENKKNIFNDKMKEYADNLKKPIDEKLSGPHNILAQSNPDPRLDLLKEKLKKFKESLNNPKVAGRLAKPLDTNKITELVRKATETPKEELSKLRESMQSLLKEKMPKITPPTEPLVGNSESIAENSPDTVSRVGEAEPQEIDGPEPQEIDGPGPNDIELQNRMEVDKNETSKLWSNNLGQIIQTSSSPKDIFFMGNGIKLPLQMKQLDDGTIDLSVDLDKLCACQNSTCPKNHTAIIEETVGAILEKEAELKDQLAHEKDPKHVFENPDIFRNKFQEVSKTKNKLFKRFAVMNNAIELPSTKDVGKQLQDTVADSVIKAQNFIKESTKQVEDALGVDNNEILNPKALVDYNMKKIQEKTDDLLNSQKIILNDIEKQTETKRKLLHNKFPALQSLKKIPDYYSYTKINALENKLEQLNNNVEQIEDENTKKFAEEAHKIFGGHNKVVEEEVNLIEKVIMWIDSLIKPDEESKV